MTALDDTLAVTATEGVAGVELARQFHPETVMLDIRLPAISGWSVSAGARHGDFESERRAAIGALGVAQAVVQLEVRLSSL